VGKKLFILILGFCLSFTIYGQTYKVGVFDNPPMVFLDEDGKPSGFFIDLLEHIAQKNGWVLEYEKCPFADCKDMLESNSIDILPDLGHSSARDSVFSFNETSIISTWAEVYYSTSRDSGINDVVDLEGLRVASLDGDYFCKNGGTGLLDLADELGLDINIFRVESYAEAMQLVEDRIVDAALVSKMFGDFNAHNYEITKSQIMISHLSLRYGISKNNPDSELIAKAIDKEVRLEISDENSLYYDLKKDYFIGAPVQIIPKWLWQIVLSLVLVVGLLIIASLVLRYQVERKTKELKETNKILRASEHEARLALNTIEASSDLAFWTKPGLGLIRVNKKATDILGYSNEEILSLQPGALVPGDLKEEFLEQFQLPNVENPHLRFESVLLKKSGERMPVEISLDRFTFEDVAYICGFARDITERKTAFRQRQELMAHLAERNKELNCLYAVSKLISDEHKSSEVILQEAAELIPLSWYYPEIACAKIKSSYGEFFSKGFVESKWEITAPIITKYGKEGLISVYYKEISPSRQEGPFSFEERNLIDTLGELLGSMIDVKGAEQKIIATIMNTEDAERKRISKEVHDSLGQTLSAIALNMDKVNQEVAVLGKKQQERFINLTNLINQAVNESRNIAHNLMPSTLNDFGYSLAVENMVESLRGATDTQFKFYSNYELGRLNQTSELGLYRITQEAVNNSVKHAKAKTITIQLMCYPDIVILTIEDDGIGFDSKSIDDVNRFGLNSMENRARSLNAEFSLDSEENKGTVVTVQLHIK